MHEVRRCPTCGSSRIAPVVRDVPGFVRGQTFCAPKVHFHECPVCGEQVFSPDAMRYIESYWPPERVRQRKAS